MYVFFPFGLHSPLFVFVLVVFLAAMVGDVLLL